MAQYVETWTGSNGAAWGSQWTLASPAGGSSTIQLNAGQQVSGSTVNQGPSARLNAVGTIADFEVVVTFNIPSQTGYCLVAYRADTYVANRAAPSNGYAAFCDGSFIRIYGWVSGSPTELGWSATPTAPLTSLRMRLQVTGSQHRLKAWDAALPEPADWHVQVSEGTYTSGFFGLGVENPSTGSVTYSWDDLTISVPPSSIAPTAGLVQTIGSAVSNVAATSTAVNSTGIKPTVGDTVVVYCARDNILNDPATADSCSDGQGNTYTRIALAQPAGTSTANAGIVGVMFAGRITTPWPAGTVTVTWDRTGASTTAAMRVEHWQGVGALRSSTTAGSAAGAPSAANAAPLAGDIVLAMEALEYSTAGTSTGDSDTTNGSWSAVAGPTATTGTTLAAVKVISQYKIVTAAGTQTYNPTHSVTASVDAVAIVAVFAPLLGQPPRRFVPAVQRAALW